MQKLNFKKIIATFMITTSVLSLNSLQANAAWKQNSTGWWYTQGTSWVTGWDKINGKWYYFNPNGYMVYNTTIDGYRLGADGSLIVSQNTNSSVNAQEKITEVTVETTEEFVNALGSNKRIILKPGEYNLSKINQINQSIYSVFYNSVYDGKELNLQNIKNLTIEGMEPGKVKITTDPRYANIINFTNVNNITIKNVIAGHTPSEYKCDAGVFKFTNSENISIMNSELYGCGSIGLNLINVKNLTTSNCTIDHCSLRALDIYDSENIKFIEDKIINHEAYSNIILLDGAKNITFEKCELANNNNFSWSFMDAYNKSNVLLDGCIIKNNSYATIAEEDCDVDCTPFFNTHNYNGIGDGKITVKDSEISNNRCDLLVDNKANIDFENCTMHNNSWK